MANDLSAAPDVAIRTVPRRDFSPPLLAELHALSNRLMAEDEKHFRIHAAANDEVHVFHRQDTGAVVGFQFWRTQPFDLPRSRAIVGGKLRIVPELRGRALHLASGLRFYVAAKQREPEVRFYRLSVASIFGFTSITSALAEYTLFDPRAPDHARDDESRAVNAAFARIAADSHFSADETTGLFAVNIFMTPETLSRYPAKFFEKPAAKIYAAINPGYRTNGCYAGFWFRFTPRNVRSLARAILTARARHGQRGRA